MDAGSATTDGGGRGTTSGAGTGASGTGSSGTGGAGTSGAGTGASSFTELGAKNVAWQVSGKVSLGTTTQFSGIILSQTSIILMTGASVKGRLLAQTAVVLDASTVVEPAR